MTAADWISSAVIVVVQQMFFSSATTSLVIQRWGRGRLPPLAGWVAEVIDIPRGVSVTVGTVAWLAIAIALVIGVTVDGVNLHRPWEVVTGAAMTALDLLWLVYLAREGPSATNQPR